jgi:aldose sugar dehydrogenase
MRKSSTRRRLTTVMLAAVFSAAWPFEARAAEVIRDEIRTEYESIRLVRVAGPLERPWALAFLPDGRLLVTERDGRLNLVAGAEITPVSGLPEVTAFGQGGLMDVALHPGYEENGWIYLTYSKGGEGGTATALIRGRLDGARLVDVEEIFVQDRFSSPGRHYGSRLAWTLDGKLLMSIGDRGVEPSRAQDLGDHAGTLLRLNDDGTPAAGNPFADTEGALPEIYSYGHRNIQGLIVHPETGEIWASEHGPRGGDELNLVRAGGNYGWPLVSRGLDYRTQEPIGVRSKEGMVDPVVDWTPSLAASGLAYVPQDSHFPFWRRNLLAGGLLAEQVRRVHFIDGEPVHEEELLRGEIGRIRDVRYGPDGHIYLLNDELDGAIYRIESLRP